jgi:hypothetical protein
VTDDIRFLASCEQQMGAYVDNLNRAIEALVLERVVGAGGSWGADSEKLGRMMHARAAFEAFPPFDGELI